MERFAFLTESGSVYQVDRPLRRIRRVSGKSAATRRFGGTEDGAWRTYVEISDVELGQRVWVSWERDPRPDEERMKHNTVTSRVVNIVQTDSSLGSV